MLLQGILFVIGFPLLIKGADLLVDGASSVAKRLKISDIVIGLTIVAFGTSAPELIVNILASFRGSSDLAISNILGSNISNIFLILGVAAVIAPMKVKSNTVWKEIPLGLLSVVLVFFLANDIMFNPSGATQDSLSRIDGLVLLSFFIVFMYYTFGLITSGQEQLEDEDIEIMTWPKSLLFIGLGGLGLAVGGNWIVDGATAIASYFNWPEAIVGLTIVAIGTSLPELATSIVAAFKNKADIAIGNVAGSNIFNVFWILGLSSVINPIPYNPSELNRDAIMAIIAAIMLFLAIFIGKKHHIQRLEGTIFLITYFAYMAYVIFY